MRIVDQQVLEPLRYRRALLRHPQRVAHEVAGVPGAGLGQHLLVDPVDLGKLELEIRVVDQGVRGLGQAPRPPRVVIRRHQVRLQPIDAADESGQERVGAATEVVALERQAVDPLEQHREPLGRAQHGLERVHPGPGHAQQQRRQIDRREREQLVVASLEQALEPRPRRVGPSLGGSQEQHPLGPAPPLDERHEPGLERPRLAGAGRPQNEQRLALARDRATLSGKQRI